MSAHRNTLRSSARRLFLRQAGAYAVPVLFAVAGPLALAASMPSARESELRAAYIYNFVRFTEWPTKTFADEVGPLIVGVLGNEAVAQALARVVKGHTVNGRPLEVRTLDSVQDIGQLHVLYVDGSQDKLIGGARGVLSSRGLLTVGESERFVALGGIIRLLVEGNRLVFEVNAAASQEAGLALSSQLLMLAKTVRRPL